MTKTPEEKPSTQVTGNVGLYKVCMELSDLGLNFMPTARNARGIDIVGHFALDFVTLRLGSTVSLRPIECSRLTILFISGFLFLESVR